MKVLVTGGAGYIGSHTIVELLAAGHQVVAVDNLANSSAESLRRVGEITGQTVPFIELDLLDRNRLDDVFQKHRPEAVIHFAGLKAVGESVAEPLRYYRTNLDATISLCEVMEARGVTNLVFSSSATVYGEQTIPQYVETMARIPTNPYGQTKAMVEQILEDCCASHKGWRVTALRYFNPVGAHPSGRIGENPLGVPNNLFPLIAQVAVGRRDRLQVYGDDYDTADGSAMRDYIHVVDLAKGHVAAIEQDLPANSFTAYNLGSGQATSVLQAIAAFQAASGQPIAYDVTARRAGDLPIYYADPTKAKHALGWQTTRTLQEMCTDTWRWQSQNPDGYGTL